MKKRRKGKKEKGAPKNTVNEIFQWWKKEEEEEKGCNLEGDPKLTHTELLLPTSVKGDPSSEGPYESVAVQ